MNIQEELFRRQGGRTKVLMLPDKDFVPYQSANGKYGYKLGDGQIVIVPQFDWAGCFEDDCAPVCVDNRYGHINKLGEIIIPCVYDHADNFHNGLALVREGEMCYLIDKSQSIRVILNSIYESLCPYPDTELLMVKSRENLVGLINREGIEILPTIYNKIFPIINGRARVCKGSHWGYIDGFGTLVIPAIYKKAGDFDKFGNAQVDIRKQDALTSYTMTYAIDKQGNIVSTIRDERVEEKQRKSRMREEKMEKIAKNTWDVLRMIRILMGR